MHQLIKSEIYFDGKNYCARCLDLDVFTQGKTLDEVAANLQEAIRLHLEGEDLAKYNLKGHPSILTMMELGDCYAR